MLANLLGPGTVEWLGARYKTILSTESTSGSMSIVDSITPAGSGPPRHVHHREDEAFVITTGECEFWLEGRSFMRGAGEAAFVSRGKEHTFRVIGPEPCRHLVILTPGGFEAFFAEMAKSQYRIPDDMEKINESASRFGLSITGPPLGA